MELTSDSLQRARFSGDIKLLEAIRADPKLAKGIDEVAAMRHHRATRMRLLASAVRVDLRLIPEVARSLETLRARVDLPGPMEAYVFEDSAVNGFVAQGRRHTLVVLSSGAVNNLSKSQLEFVIGHELGHAVYGHLEVGAALLLKTATIDPRSSMQLLAWQRAAEISADRAGLLCCGSLEVAATALFKTISGLDLENLQVDPADFASQWEYLEREVLESGEEDHWQLSHPFPPLRMKAMIAFDEMGLSAEADPLVERLLAHMDPLARESAEAADPVLADFFLWGGLYMALANGVLHDAEIERIASCVSRGRVSEAVEQGPPTPEQCLEQFKQCIANRRQKLRAMEIHRVIQGLMIIAAADGDIDDQEVEALRRLAEEMGIAATACELILTKYREGA